MFLYAFHRTKIIRVSNGKNVNYLRRKLNGRVRISSDKKRNERSRWVTNAFWGGEPISSQHSTGSTLKNETTSNFLRRNFYQKRKLYTFRVEKRNKNKIFFLEIERMKLFKTGLLMLAVVALAVNAEEEFDSGKIFVLWILWKWVIFMTDYLWDELCHILYITYSIWYKDQSRSSYETVPLEIQPERQFFAKGCFFRLNFKRNF